MIKVEVKHSVNSKNHNKKYLVDNIKFEVLLQIVFNYFFTDEKVSSRKISKLIIVN